MKEAGIVEAKSRSWAVNDLVGIPILKQVQGKVQGERDGKIPSQCTIPWCFSSWMGRCRLVLAGWRRTVVLEGDFKKPWFFCHPYNFLWFLQVLKQQSNSASNSAPTSQTKRLCSVWRCWEFPSPLIRLQFLVLCSEGIISKPVSGCSTESHPLTPPWAMIPLSYNFQFWKKTYHWSPASELLLSLCFSQLMK